MSMDDGAVLVRDAACPTMMWDEVMWSIAGLLLGFGVVLLVLMALAFAVYDWRRGKQHRWPK